MADKNKVNTQGKDIGTMLLESLMRIPARAMEQQQKLPLPNLGDLAQFLSQNNPVARLAGGIGAASTYVPGQEGSGQQVLQQMQKEMMPQLPNKEDILRKIKAKAAEKAVSKRYNAYAEEAPTEALIPHTETAQKMMEEANQTIEPQTATATEGASQEQEQGRSILNKLMIAIGSGMAAAGGQGTVVPSILSLATKGQDLENEMKKMETEYGYKAQLEAIKSGLDPNSPAVQGQILVNDISNLMETYDKINLKGRIGGTIGAAVSPTGYQREERAEFSAAAQSLVYTVAASIAGQEGRALSDRDIKLVESWAKFKLTDRKGDFRGKMKNLLKKAAARGIDVPDLDKLGESQGYTASNIKSIQPYKE